MFLLGLIMFQFEYTVYSIIIFLTISYNFRRHYHLSVPRSFTELLATHSPEVVEGMRKSYSTVEDIELYIGGELFFY